MTRSGSERMGAYALISGSILFAAYASLFPLLLPLGDGTYDRAALALNANWVPLAGTAFAGVVLMMIGFHAAWERMRARSGRLGTIGILLIEAAYLLQACKVTWELCLFPVIASHPESAFLLRDAVIAHSPGVLAFRYLASATIFLGVTTFCLALYRSGEFSRTAPALIFSGAVVYAVGPAVSIFLSIAGIMTLALGCAVVGARLLRPAS